MASKENQTVRLISEGGKISFRWCRVDDDGDVDAIASEPITLQSVSYSAVLQVLERCMQSASLPVLVLNSGNRAMYQWD